MLAVTDHPLTPGVLDLQRPQGRAPGGPLREHQGVVAYRFGRCEVRPACREVFVDGARRRLQPRAFDLLIYLIDHRHRVLSIDELLDAVWHGREVQVCSLATAIGRIRSVLESTASGVEAVIRTHHRVGYRFVAPLKATPALHEPPAKSSR